MKMSEKCPKCGWSKAERSVEIAHRAVKNITHQTWEGGRRMAEDYLKLLKMANRYYWLSTLDHGCAEDSERELREFLDEQEYHSSDND
jgi:hypothetical protein